MPEILGPCAYRSTESAIAQFSQCVICKEVIGLGKPYLFWWRGNSYAPKDLRRACEACFDKKYGKDTDA